MAITRKQYITVAELNEVTNGSYADDTATTLLIYEASELISHHTLQKSDYATNDDIVNNLKLATAYQVEYLSDNSMIDSDYNTESSISLGRYSKSNSSGGQAQEWQKISPKTNRLLMDSGLLYRGADTSYGGNFD